MVIGPTGELRATGLDYAAARAGLDMAELKLDPGEWADLQVIETGALAEMREERERS